MQSVVASSLRTSKSTLVRVILYAAAAAAAAAVVAAAPSVARADGHINNCAPAACPKFSNVDTASESRTVDILSVGDNQILVGPPVRAVDSDAGDTLTYRLTDTAAGSGDSSRFTISTNSTRGGQISRRTTGNNVASKGVYRVTVSVADDGDFSDTDNSHINVTIYVTSPGNWPLEDGWLEAQRMTTSSSVTAPDWFGSDVASDGNIIVVGASRAEPGSVTDAGAVYVFDTNGNQLALLQSPNAVTDGYFGYSVALARDTIFVGAFGETVGTVVEAGRVYVFKKPPTGWANDSTPDATLTPGPKSAPNDADNGIGPNTIFGSHVDVSDDGNTLVVGAPGRQDTTVNDQIWSSSNQKSDSEGAIFVFTKPSGGWANTTSDATGVVRLTAGDEEYKFNALGRSVAITGDGNTIVGGAPLGGNAAGKLFVFTKTSSGWSSASQTATEGWLYVPRTAEIPGLTISGYWRNNNERRLGMFNVDVSDDGSTIVAGAPTAYYKDQPAKDATIFANHLNSPELRGEVRKGEAYVYVKPAGGWADMTETAELSTYGHRDDRFGIGVAISPSGNMIAATNGDARSSNFRGSVYVFTKPSGGWENDTDGLGDNLRVLTAATTGTLSEPYRYGFGNKGLAFIGESGLVATWGGSSAILEHNDGLTTLTTGGLFGDNEDHSTSANVNKGAAAYYRLRLKPGPPVVVQPPGYVPPSGPPPPPPGPPPPPPPPEFVDVDEDSVHAASIETVAELRITMGTSATMFSPSDTVTRAQMASFVARTWEAADRECPSSGASYFDDVPAGSTHTAGIDCVSALGVARGTAERMFSPSAPVTRAQMASFLANAWRAADRTCPASDASSIFDDVAADSVHAESIGCIAALGITRGTAAGMFSPSDTVTRAQMASFLTRFYEQLTGTA